MSGRLVGEVLNHAPTDLRPLDLLVLISIAESARDRDRTAITDSSSEAIAYRVRSTPGSVRNALQRLKKRALIRPVHAKAHRGQQQNWTITELSDYHREGARLDTPKGAPLAVTQSNLQSITARGAPNGRAQPVDNSPKASPKGAPKASPQS
jgi:hypothetical protein